MTDPLKLAQAEARKAERRMLTFLLSFTATQTLSVEEVKQIASTARDLAFDATEPFRKEPS
ncbi:MAG: hypothetical protein CL484_03100 [Acidobacteria bacterium]|nr:hypothetical protein [Acidobacteriota bacterium]|tara:strand:+ start:162 stop:344 length:183 start_codon:yes stop_codon:yes gene_type:complete